MAKVKEVTVMTGISFDHKGVWYKNEACIKMELDEKDDVEEVYEDCWNQVINEVEKQVNSIVEE